MGNLTITADKIRAMFLKINPVMRDVWITDKEFIQPDMVEIESLIDIYLDELSKYIPELGERDDFALLFMADIRRHRMEGLIKLEDVKQRFNIMLNWAFGLVMGTQFQGRNKKRICIFFISGNRIYLLDTQSKEIWPYEQGRDNIYFALV